MKIFLIGFMGAGKSLLGKHLAARLGLVFLDMDAALEEKERMTIQEIFSKNGEDYFRELEAMSLRELTECADMVVATGGGIPCYHNNMKWMNEHGLTIFLNVPVEELASRLVKETNNRPLLKGKSPNELKKFIQNKLEERNCFYNQAHFVCQADHPVDELVEALVKYFKRFFVKLDRIDDN